MKASPRTVLLIVAGVAVFVALLITHFGDSPTGGAIPLTGSTAATVSVPASGNASPAPESAGPAASGAPATTGGEQDHDDGTDDKSPLLVEPTSAPDAREAATQFVAAWLNTYERSPEDWRAGILGRVTADLAEDLAGADPATVPAAAKTGPVDVTVQGSLVGADAPIVTAEAKPQPVGTLHLTLVKKGSHWLVSEIDWEPSR